MEKSPVRSDAYFPEWKPALKYTREYGARVFRSVQVNIDNNFNKFMHLMACTKCDFRFRNVTV